MHKLHKGPLEPDGQGFAFTEDPLHLIAFSYIFEAGGDFVSRKRPNAFVLFLMSLGLSLIATVLANVISMRFKKD